MSTTNIDADYRELCLAIKKSAQDKIPDLEKVLHPKKEELNKTMIRIKQRDDNHELKQLLDEMMKKEDEITKIESDIEYNKKLIKRIDELLN